MLGGGDERHRGANMMLRVVGELEEVPSELTAWHW